MPPHLAKKDDLVRLKKGSTLNCVKRLQQYARAMNLDPKSPLDYMTLFSILELRKMLIIARKKARGES